MSTSQPAFELDSENRAQIEHLAATGGCTPNEVVREALADYSERVGQRDRFLADVLAAADDYDRTGLHLTGEEVDAWLAKIEAGEDAELPPCHT